MAKFKAKKEFKELKNKFFGIHKIKAFENGAVLEITDVSAVPKEVLECLENIDKPKKENKKKGDK